MKDKKKAFAVLFLALIIGATTTVWYLRRNNNDSDNPRKIEQAIVSEGQESANTTKQNNKVDNVDNTDSSPSRDITPRISSIERNNNEIVIKTSIENYSSGTGTCELQARKNNLVVTREAQIIYQSDYSTCMGFSVNRSDFQEAGMWDFIIAITDTNGTETVSSQFKFDVGSL